MADPRTSFITLEDVSTQAGLPLHKAVEGDAFAGKNMHGALVAKSGSNLALLKVNPSTGALYTDSVSVTVAKMSSPAGQLAAGSATLANVTNAVITLTPDAVYRNLSVVVACRRDALFQLVQTDNVTDTVLAEFIVGSGDYTQVAVLTETEITAGSTGTQELKIVAKNFEALSSLRGTVMAAEVQ